MADLDALVRRVIDDVISQGKVELIDELLAEDFVEHQAMPGMPSGREALKAFTEMFRSAFPDLKVEILATAVDGDEAWAHTRMSGTHQGEFNGIPPTGKTISVEAMDRVRARDGKIVEHWGVSDDLGMMTQLGVVPDMG